MCTFFGFEKGLSSAGSLIWVLNRIYLWHVLHFGSRKVWSLIDVCLVFVLIRVVFGRFVPYLYLAWVSKGVSACSTDCCTLFGFEQGLSLTDVYLIWV